MHQNTTENALTYPQKCAKIPQKNAQKYHRKMSKNKKIPQKMHQNSSKKGTTGTPKNAQERPKSAPKYPKTMHQNNTEKCIKNTPKHAPK